MVILKLYLYSLARYDHFPFREIQIYGKTSKAADGGVVCAPRVLKLAMTMIVMVISYFSVGIDSAIYLRFPFYHFFFHFQRFL